VIDINRSEVKQLVDFTQKFPMKQLIGSKNKRRDLN